MDTVENMNTIEQALYRRPYWLNLSRKWKLTYWVIGILSLISSSIAAATSLSDKTAPFFSFIATLCIGFVGFANPQQRAQRYLQAYRVLDKALLKYDRSEKTKQDVEIVGEAIDAAEEVANPGSTTTPATPPSQPG